MIAACSASSPPPKCSAPRLLDELNSPAEDRSPWLAADGLEIFFSSNRTGSSEIYRATRATTEDPFSAPAIETALSSPDIDYDPFMSSDGLTMWTWHKDIGVFRTHRADRDSEFDVPQLEASILGRHPSLTDDELTVYTASLHLTPTEDIFVATRVSTADPFDPPSVLSISTELADQGPSISGDGRVLLFGTTGITADQSLRIGRATLRGDTFSTPTVLEELDPQVGFDDRDAQQGNGDGLGATVVFASNRPGQGDLDLWIVCE